LEHELATIALAHAISVLTPTPPYVREDHELCALRTFTRGAVAAFDPLSAVQKPIENGA